MSAAVRDERFILTADKLREDILAAIAAKGKLCLSGGIS
jgi:hypothetical protein